MTNPTKEPVTNPKYQVWVVDAAGVVKVTFWNLEAEAARDMVQACLKDCDGGATLSVRLMAKAEEALAGEARRVTYGELQPSPESSGASRQQVTNQGLGAANGAMTNGATRMTSQARIRATAKELAGQWPEELVKVRAEKWTEEERQGWLR